MHYASAARVEPGSTIAVYDLGGGTFDAAVVHKAEDGSFELLGPPEGIECLGGIDFDDLVLDRVLPPTGCSDPVAMARLRRECTEAKEALSSDVSAVVPVLLPDVQTQVRLTRPEFESLIQPILLETVQSLSRAISSAGLDLAEVTSVLLVGGSSRIPLVTDLISAELGRPVTVDTDPKGVVALGAALAAHESTIMDGSDVDGLIPEPRRPDHDCDPPTLTRPRRRLRRTRVILYTLGMLVLALMVIPSPFTSDSGKSSTTKKDQPTQAGSPAADGRPPQPGTTKKHTPKAQQAGATSPSTEEEAIAATDRESGQQPQPVNAEARTGPSPAISATESSATSASPADTQSTTADAPSSDPTTAAEPPPPPPDTQEDPPPPPPLTEDPSPPDPEPTSTAEPPPPEPTETS
jgi:molecular chaperone DnaK